MTRLNRDVGEFLCVPCACSHAHMCVCLCVRVCAYVYGRMLLVFQGLLFVTVTPPNEEVERVSVFYYSPITDPVSDASFSAHQLQALVVASVLLIWVHSSPPSAQTAGEVSPLLFKQ